MALIWVYMQKKFTLVAVVKILHPVMWKNIVKNYNIFKGGITIFEKIIFVMYPLVMI